MAGSGYRTFTNRGKGAFFNYVDKTRYPGNQRGVVLRGEPSPVEGG